MEENNQSGFMRFDLPKDQSSIIKVIGVGGGGSNAVNYMYEQGIQGVDFVVCNTDAQALDKSSVPTKIQLGATLTEGRGAGSLPQVGRNAAVENLDDVKEILEKNTTMAFITAGMGGGTGTGAAPIIARAAKEMGILTVGIVTVPFAFEGKKRSTQADEGLREMRDAVDTLLVIKNDKLRELYGNLSLKKAFAHADEVLCTAAKGIAEVITLTGEVNVDMNDVNTVMRESGVAIMGSGHANGDGRAMKAVTTALESPLLNDNVIEGAKFVLLNITYGSEEVLMDEITEITDYIQEQAGMSAEVIWGYGADESLEDSLCVTVIATGFKSSEIDSGIPTDEEDENKIRRFNLDKDEPREITGKISNPTQPTQIKNEEEKPDEVDESEPFIIQRKSTEEPKKEEPRKEEQSQLFHDDEPEVNESTDYSVSDQEEASSQRNERASEDAEEKSGKKIYDLNDDSLNNMDEEVTFKFHSSHDDKESKSKINITDVDEEDEPKSTSTESNRHVEDRPSREEFQAKNKSREQRIREFTHKLKTPSGLSDLESEPAYKRRNVKLDNVKHSSESNVSRYTISEETDENGEKKTQIRENNSFLHDNVD
ncbi:cell division protein FtsZ [Halocola ammonii]